MLTKKQRDTIGRIVVSIALALIFTTGLAATFRSLPIYGNYWGGVIYGPIAMLISLLGLYIVIFKHKQADQLEREIRKKGYKSPLDGIKW